MEVSSNYCFIILYCISYENKCLFTFLTLRPTEEYNSDSEDESGDEKMTVDDAVSEENSDVEAENPEEYETITISEVPNEQQYDLKMDLQEEKQAIVKFKGRFYIFAYINQCIIHEFNFNF
jgi:hypothetical protein